LQGSLSESSSNSNNNNNNEKYLIKNLLNELEQQQQQPQTRFVHGREAAGDLNEEDNVYLMNDGEIFDNNDNSEDDTDDAELMSARFVHGRSLMSNDDDLNIDGASDE
jgi:hypothetical protein